MVGIEVISVDSVKVVVSSTVEVFVILGLGEGASDVLDDIDTDLVDIEEPSVVNLGIVVIVTGSEVCVVPSVDLCEVVVDWVVVSEEVVNGEALVEDVRTVVSSVWKVVVSVSLVVCESNIVV